ncbi:F-box/FBD/LRR-repeat protein At1g13570-like [Lolium rigidum]|uniref:F-box/FBD/LRR-repeat protein At1g13570-like n=1 Tax=Lolium rigidum TaxID=89674 RepID=UPI001F5D2E74|nr:F-box/FBD/LRR-repeat protein At1g13570-like [Lolium rigidum]
MDAAAAGQGELRTYADVEEFFNNMSSEGPSAQDRIDYIVPYIISLLPPPFVPAPDAADASDSEDEHFSLTSSSSDDDERDADWPAVFPAAQGDGQDHISRLTNDLLANVISRLPTKEAARTMVLSARWRGLWPSTPLLVDDAHLRYPGESREIPGFHAVRAISRCVAAHPGPVRGVRITRTSFHMQEYALQRLVAGLAAKNVQDLILFNRPWPLNMPLPDDILRCASLTRLYLGVWHFPDTAAHRPNLPNLQELGLFHTIIADRDIDALLARCRKLKILSFAMSYNSDSRLRVRSRSLSAVVEWRCSLEEIVVDDAPCLERLLFDSIGDRRLVKIVQAPRLEVLGFLDLQLHELQIGGIVIKAGMNVRARAMLPSLKIFAVKVRFLDQTEVKMLPTLLRCFPSLETLHVMSIPGSPDTVVPAGFWESLGSCDCLRSHLKTLVLHGFQNLNQELLFLNYILEKGKMLKTLCIVRSEIDDFLAEACHVVPEVGPTSGFILQCDTPSGGSSGSDISVCPASRYWSFQHAIDLSVKDPFYASRHDVTWIACRTEDESLCF